MLALKQERVQKTGDLRGADIDKMNGGYYRPLFLIIINVL